jgi:hypothetical protein
VACAEASGVSAGVAFEIRSTITDTSLPLLVSSLISASGTILSPYRSDNEFVSVILCSLNILGDIFQKEVNLNLFNG